MKRILFVMIIGAVCVGLVPASTQAQEDIITATMDACQPEIETYCSQVTLGEGRLLACFYAHEDKLSGRCSYALYQAAAELEQFAAAVTHVAASCLDDLETHCSQVQVGEGRVAACLMEHKDEVSEPCSQAMEDVGLEVVEEE